MQCEESRRVRLVRRLMLTSAMSTALFAAPAGAMDDAPETFGAGLFAGYAFGPGAGFQLGLEAFVTHRYGLNSCSSEERSGVGGSVQLGFIRLRDLRVTLAAHAGGETVRGLSAFSAEAGVTYRDDLNAFGVHTGLLAETLLAYGAFRYQWLLNDAGVVGGVRFPGTYGTPGFCAVGRPLRTESGFASLGAARREPRRRRGIAGERARNAAVGHGWERDAQLECASVPAFLQLAADLLEHGAPSELVERALDAAEDEMGHAALCARMASRHLGVSVQPTLPPSAWRPSLAGLAGLQRLATESWLDGCLSEGSAAAHAASAAARATDREARAAQTRIARDEGRHAALAWSILGWAAERGGDAVRESVFSLRDVECNSATEECAPEGLEDDGRLGARRLNAISSEHAKRARTRLDVRGYAYSSSSSR